MKRTARGRLGFVSTLAVIAVCELLVPGGEALAQGPGAAPPSGGSGTADGILAIGVIAGLLVLIGVAVKLYDRRRKREDEAIAAQARLSNALLNDPTLYALPVAPQVHMPFWRRGPIIVELTGRVPSAELREAILRLVTHVLADRGSEVQINDRIVVDRSMVGRAA